MSKLILYFSIIFHSLFRLFYLSDDQELYGYHGLPNNWNQYYYLDAWEEKGIILNHTETEWKWQTVRINPWGGGKGEKYNFAICQDEMRITK